MTSPEQYTPRDLSALDALLAAKRTADAILRNNPLTDAVVSHGLMKWIGNHANIFGSGNVNFFWVGEFLPADPTMGGRPQCGVAMWRDDSTGGTLAFALYDHNPGGDGLGLRQTLHFDGGDGKQLWQEARNGGQRWPQVNIAMGMTSANVSEWQKTLGTANNFQTIGEGRFSVLGNHVSARFWFGTIGGAAGEARVRIEVPGGTDIVGNTFTMGVNSNNAFEDKINVSSQRGNTVVIRFEVRTTNSTGQACGSVISFRNYTDAA